VIRDRPARAPLRTFSAAPRVEHHAGRNGEPGVQVTLDVVREVGT